MSKQFGKFITVGKAITVILLLSVIACACQLSSERNPNETEEPPIIDIEKGTAFEYIEYVPKPGEDIYFSPSYSTHNNFIVYSIHWAINSCFRFRSIIEKDEC